MSHQRSNRNMEFFIFGTEINFQKLSTAKWLFYGHYNKELYSNVKTLSNLVTVRDWIKA